MGNACHCNICSKEKNNIDQDLDINANQDDLQSSNSL